MKATPLLRVLTILSCMALLVLPAAAGDGPLNHRVFLPLVWRPF